MRQIGQTYHFSGSNFNSVFDVVKTVCDLKAHNIKKLIKKGRGRIGHDLVYKLGTKKTRITLNWKPIYPLRKGLKEIIIYHNRHFNNVPNKLFKYIDTSLKK